MKNKATTSSASGTYQFDDTIEQSVGSTNIMDVNNDIDISAGTVNTSLFTSLNLKVEILEKKYNDLIPLLKDCCDNANELRKTRAISDIVGMAPAIDFNKSDTFVFAKVYIFVKSELVKLNPRYAGNFSLIFGYLRRVLQKSLKVVAKMRLVFYPRSSYLLLKMLLVKTSCLVKSVICQHHCTHCWNILDLSIAVQERYHLLLRTASPILNTGTIMIMLVQLNYTLMWLNPSHSW